MQKLPHLDEQLLPISFVLHRILKNIQFSNNPEALRNGPFKMLVKPTEVTFELFLWPESEKHFLHFELIWLRIILQNFCSFLTFSHIMY